MTTLDWFFIIAALIAILIALGLFDKLARWSGWED